LKIVGFGVGRDAIPFSNGFLAGLSLLMSEDECGLVFQNFGAKILVVWLEGS